jgi:hypothetical protein
MNESRTCVICQHATERMACLKCQRRMHDHLGEIVTYAALAGAELLPGRGGDGRSTERGLGIRLDALDFIAGFNVLPVLELWERDWRETYGLTPYGPASAERNAGKGQESTLVSVIGFLRQWLDRACTDHPAIDDFHDEVRTCWHQARNAANAQPRQAWRVTCPADTNDGECGKSLRLTGEDVDGIIVCRKCKTNWTFERLLRVAFNSTAATIWLDPESAETYFSISRNTLRKWAKANHIQYEGGRYNFQSVRMFIDMSKDREEIRRATI